MATNPNIHPVLARELEEMREHLRNQRFSDYDESFVLSLANQLDRKGFLSDRQLPYWTKHLEAARKRSKAGSGGSSIEEVFDGKLIRDLLFKAAQSLKYPSLRLQNDECGKIVLYVAGPLSKSPGYVVISNGEKWPSKIVYGSIDLSGNGSLRRTSEQKHKTFIRRIAKDPVGEAKLCGQRYSYCCFCALELTSPISIYHGYGPICAGKWGLPWEGPATEEDKQKELEHIKLVDLDTTLGEGEQT